MLWRLWRRPTRPLFAVFFLFFCFWVLWYLWYTSWGPGILENAGFWGCEFWSDLEWSGYQRSLELPPAWNISTNGRMLNAGKSNSFGVKKGGEVGEFWKSSQVPVTVTFSFRFFWKNKQLQKSFSLVTFNCSHLVSRWGAGGFPRKLVGIAFRENHQPIPMDPVVPPMDGSMGNHGLKMNIPKFCKQAEYAVYIYIYALVSTWMVSNILKLMTSTWFQQVTQFDEQFQASGNLTYRITLLHFLQGTLEKWWPMAGRVWDPKPWQSFWYGRRTHFPITDRGIFSKQLVDPRCRQSRCWSSRWTCAESLSWRKKWPSQESLWIIRLCPCWMQQVGVVGESFLSLLLGVGECSFFWWVDFWLGWTGG